MPQFTCATCNRPFDVAEETLAKYPGWKPRFCMTHRKAGVAQSRFGKNATPLVATAPPSEPPRTPGEPVVPKRLPPGYAYGSRTFGRGLPTREVLTPAEALERYRDGPQTGVFTDGSCDPNPGPGGWAFVHVRDGEIVAERCGGDRDTTNNRMEMSAIIAALDALPADADVTLYSDSELCVKTLTVWAKTWKARGWQRKGGNVVANIDLVMAAVDALDAHPNVALRWIKAHDGSRWNEYADALATRGLRETGSRPKAAGPTSA